MKQQALAEHAQIAGALAQIVILQPGKLRRVLLNHGFNRPFRHGPLLNLGKEIFFQARIAEQVRIEIENCRTLFLHAGGEAFTEAAEFGRRLAHCQRQAFAFALNIERGSLCDLIEGGLRGINPAGCHRHAGRGGDSANTRLSKLAK